MKITFTAVGHVSRDTLDRNEAYSKSLGFPKIAEAKATPLAIAGGAPSVSRHIDDLREWPGEVWAINGAWSWCRSNGIDAAFFSVDPSPKIAILCGGAKRAILSMSCDPSVFNTLNLDGSDIEAVLVGGPHGVPSGCTTATCAPAIAAMRGHTSVTYFGCESSFEKTSHAYGDLQPEYRIKVSCNGEEFVTNPGMTMQAELLATLIRQAPDYLFERSGGLLGAMIQDPEIDVIAATRQIHESMETAGAP